VDGLCEALLVLREAGAPDKRWSTMQHSIAGGRFDAFFTYRPLDGSMFPDRSTLPRRPTTTQRDNRPQVSGNARC
jgi:hypothetical protein